jgi:hypothetical protein
VQACRAHGKPELLRFGPDEVLARIAAQGDLFAAVVSTHQKLPGLED